MSHILARLVAALVLAAVLTTPVSGQVTIQVVDANGRPIPSVRIDVFGLGELIGVDSTSARGVAELDDERWSEVRRISLSHLGFQTLVVQAHDLPADGVLHLEPEATAIEGLMVEGGELCPVLDEPAARRLWSEVAARYSTDTGHRAWSAYMSQYGGSVREGELHLPPGGTTIDRVVAGQGGTIHGGDHSRRSVEERVSEEGYTWPPLVIAGTSSARQLAWAYPMLEREHSYHFATAVFGELHSFAVASESDGEVSLVFCGNGEGKGATIHGVLRLVPEASFVAADWRFSGSDPNEGAGGYVQFTDYIEDPGAKPHLVSSGGYFFRHRSKHRPYPDFPRMYSRYGIAEVRWFLHPTADNPCNGGLSFYMDPPTSAQGVRFADCVARTWGR